MTTHPHKKTILAVWHSAGRGKTATLRELARLLLQEYQITTPIFSSVPIPLPDRGDFRLVIRIGGLIVVVESQGDPNTGLDTRLLQLVNGLPATPSRDSIPAADVILCSTRTGGATVRAVQAVEALGFEAIWTSTYQVAQEALHPMVNQLKAKHLLDLLRDLGRLP